LEYKKWCEAKAGESVNGVATLANKVVYDVTVTPDKALLYIQDHLTRRPNLNSNQKPIAGTTAGPSVIKKHRKMLADVYKEQCANSPEQMKGILPPRTADVSGILSGESVSECTYPHKILG